MLRAYFVNFFAIVDSVTQLSVFYPLLNKRGYFRAEPERDRRIIGVPALYLYSRADFCAGPIKNCRYDDSLMLGNPAEVRTRR